MTDQPREDLKEKRLRARLAWNGWPNTPESHRIIADHEARDPYSACAWDRVILAVTKEIQEEIEGLGETVRNMSGG